MAVSLSTNTLSTVVRNTNFSETVNISTTTEDISSVVVTPSQTDVGITIAVATDFSSITFSGSYEEAYDQDEIKSLPNGESDKTTTPTISKSFAQVPEGHFVFSAIQDTRDDIEITYSVSIVHDEGTENETITHIVDTDTTSFQNKLRSLYPPDQV